MPYKVEEHHDLTCSRSGANGFFMNEIPQEDGSSAYELSDSGFGVKHIQQSTGDAVTFGKTWYENGEMAE